MSFTGSLLAFQEPAVKMMLDVGHVLVAYEMGLGKTVITIAATEDLLERGEVRMVLVIVPSSLKYQWRRMIDKFTDGATVRVIDGDPPTRTRQYSEAMTEDYDYVICNYEQILNDWPFIQKLPVDCVVVDECTAIKNFRAKRTRKIKKLQVPYRYGLSGQPLENRPEEVYSIMEWIEPDFLGRFDTFDRTFIKRNHFGKVRYYKNLPTLHRKLAERMVRKRRLDEDVRDQLPKVTEQVMSVKFDIAGARLYRIIAKELLDEMAMYSATFGGSGFDIMQHYGVAGPGDSDEMMARGKIMSKLTALRMLCDHPGLLAESAAKKSSAYAVELGDRGHLGGLTSTPKLTECMGLLNDILAADPANKVVLFSFFKGNLRYLHEHYGAQAVMFHGEMDAKAKDVAKTKFQTQPDVRLFLSSDAGGYGVDLPEANYLCVEASTPILNASLQWEPAGALRQWDGIWGCEEDARPGRGYGRRWRSGHVLNNQIQRRQCLRVLLSNGESLVVTPEHRLLVQTGHGDHRWAEAQSLRVGWRVPRYLDHWKTGHTFEDGWVSGLLDGEGCVSRCGHGLMVGVSQNPGMVLEELRRRIEVAGFSCRESVVDGHAVVRLLINGGKAEQMRFLGTFRPIRLISRWRELVEQHTIRAIEAPTVVAVERAGQRDVAVLETSCRTYVGAGYMHHNCNYDLPWSAGKLDQRNARIVRLSSTWESVTLINLVMQGSVEERMYGLLEQKKAIASAVVDGKGIDKKGNLSLDLKSLTEFLQSSTV